jgi:phosphopantetheinyl transferase
MHLVDVHYCTFSDASLAASNVNIEGMISEDEKRRMASFKGVELQQKYGLSRFLLRSFLAKKFDCRPHEIDIAIGNEGRPYIRNRPNWDFNLSHSNNTFLLGVSDSCKIGVDVELSSDRLSYEKIARRYFHPVEVAQLEDQHHVDRVDLFLQLWTLKEAFKKASEINLSDALKSYAFTVDAGTPRLAHPHDRPWFYQSFRIGQEWAAIACPGKDTVEFRHTHGYS